MSMVHKSKEEILQKFGIMQLNEMQQAAEQIIPNNEDVIILSPTGSGKTLAFLLPLIDLLDPEIQEVQAIIITPTRELALQIEKVSREMGSGYKVNALYGGRPIAKDFEELQTLPAILIGTPGRIADHLSRESFKANEVKTLILDEFDKSLEIGFSDEMKEIIWALPAVNRKILTSATKLQELPSFMSLRDPTYIDFSSKQVDQLNIEYLRAETADKLILLGRLIKKIEDDAVIVFCNFKDSINRVSDFLTEHNISHSCFYGGLEQHDRERALIKFRNKTAKVLLATDLAARGIDIPEIKHIVHYHLPIKEEEFIHRNGRTARMHASGTAYILLGIHEELPAFINAKEISIDQLEATKSLGAPWTTVFISGGRKDKISKGDIAGFFLKEGGIKKEQLGLIELKTDCAFVAVQEKVAKELVQKLNNTKLKKRKLRVKLLDE